MAVWCTLWSPAGPRKSLDIRGVLLFVVALLSWRLLLASRRIIGVIGGGLGFFRGVCGVVAGDVTLVRSSAGRKNAWHGFRTQQPKLPHSIRVSSCFIVQQ